MNKKIESKTGTLKKKIKNSVGKLVKPAKKLAAYAAIAACAVGCATADQNSPQPNEQKSVQAGKSETQNVEMHNSNIYIFVGVSKVPRIGSTNVTEMIAFGDDASDLGHTISVLSQAQALESTGTESYDPSNASSNTPSNAPIASPVNDVKPDTSLTYGLQSECASGRSWIADLTDAGVRGLSEILKARKTESVTVEHKSGEKETVRCSNGTCTNSKGDKITYCGDTSSGSCGTGCCRP